MSAGVTRISDVVVPEIFTPYVQQLTEEKSRLIQSGAVVSDSRFTSLLSGGGLTLSFEQKLLNSRVFYDPQTDTLTIRGVPPNLKDQLLRQS